MQSLSLGENHDLGNKRSNRESEGISQDNSKENRQNDKSWHRATKRPVQIGAGKQRFLQRNLKGIHYLASSGSCENLFRRLLSEQFDTIINSKKRERKQSYSILLALARKICRQSKSCIYKIKLRQICDLIILGSWREGKQTTECSFTNVKS